MTTSAKSLKLAQELSNYLDQRGYAPTLKFDSDSNPLILCGSGTPGADNVCIKVMPRDWPLAKDVLGNTAFQYTPSTVMVALEATDDGEITLDSATFIWPILGECFMRGARTELWQEANGTAPTASTFATPSNLVASFESLQYPLVSSQ